jgi:hypothetical protein
MPTMVLRRTGAAAVAPAGHIEAALVYSPDRLSRKTELRPRQRITRPLRQRHGLATRNSANRERPPQDWIEIAVPAPNR